MRRLAVAAAVTAALVASGCAVGNPQPATDLTDTGATLHGDVYSNFAGDTEYWWRYGETTVVRL